MTPNNCSIPGQPKSSKLVTGNFKYSANKKDFWAPLAKNGNLGSSNKRCHKFDQGISKGIHLRPNETRAEI